MKLSIPRAPYTVFAIAMTIGTLYSMQMPKPSNDQAILDKIAELQVSTAMQQISLLGVAKHMHPLTKMAQLIKIQNTLHELQHETKDVKLRQKIMFAIASVSSLEYKLGIEYPEALAWAEEEARKKSKGSAAKQTPAPGAANVREGEAPGALVTG